MREAEFAKRLNVLVKTANYNLTRLDSGSLVTNVGAAGAVVINLPEFPEVGDVYHFTLGAAQGLTVDLVNTSHKFIIGGAVQAANKNISADDEAESVSVVYVGGNQWLCRHVVGTWTVEA